MRFFYNTTSKDSICDDIDFLVGSTSATYPLQAKQRNVNQSYFNVVRMIWESQDAWQYDDSNRDGLSGTGYLSSMAVIRDTISAGKYQYTLPTNAQRVRTVFYNNIALSPKDPDTMLFTESGTPLYYGLQGRDILLEPVPSSALTDGLKAYVDRTPSAFGSASTNSPGFPEPFHRILSYQAAIDFTQDQQQRNAFLLQKTQLEMALKNFYSHRSPEQQNKINPRSKKMWRRYT